MRKSNIFLQVKPLLLLLALITCMALYSCAPKEHFTQSTVVPAAEGTIKVKKGKNGNHDIRIKNYPRRHGFSRAH